MFPLDTGEWEPLTWPAAGRSVVARTAASSVVARGPFLVTACTIIARNRLAHARVLADSFLAHHSDGVISVLVIDDEARTLDDSGERFHGLRLGDIGLDRAEIARLATIYDDAELVEAVKPVLLRHLLTGGRTSSTWIQTSRCMIHSKRSRG